MLTAGIVAEAVLLYLVVRAEKLPRPLAKADAAVVLGARVEPTGAPSTQLKYRLLRALDVYEQGLVDYVVVCGAQGSDEPASEAEVMANFLIARGVPQEKILRDDQSFDTKQNLVHAKALMAELGLETAILVTSDYHVQRALWTGRDIGLPCQGAGAQASDYPALLWKSRLRETIGWLKYFALDRGRA